MKWVEYYGEGHAVVGEGEETPGYLTACDRLIDLEADVQESADVHGRPFGGATCQRCHFTAKAWAAKPETMPEYVRASLVPAKPAKMTAEARKAAVEGRSTPDAAPRASRPAASQEDTSLDFPEEPGIATSGGAVVVAPPRKSRGRTAVDREFDSDPT